MRKPVTATSHTQHYGPGNAVDGDPHSYWESANQALPQSIQVDLGAVRPVTRVVLTLPPVTAWEARTQTLTVTGSADGSAYTALSASAARRFDPATGNAVTITFPQAPVRYLRVQITANTAWPAAQLSGLSVYATP
ncbi:discoidin domain-containing protein [Streptomyces microflavus]